MKRLRRAWPDVKIVFCGDGGFCRPRILSWRERNRVDYIGGIARNVTLPKKAESIMELAAMGHETVGKKVRVFDEFPYAARVLAAALPAGDRQGRTCRALRHGISAAFCREKIRASYAVMSSENLPLIGRILGHRPHRTTAGYAHLSDAHLVEAAERVGGLIADAMDLECAPPSPHAPVQLEEADWL